ARDTPPAPEAGSRCPRRSGGCDLLSCLESRDWGLGIGGGAGSGLEDSRFAVPNPESPIPNPFVCLAGAAGFEPAHAGIKTRCLNRLATPLGSRDWGLGIGTGNGSTAFRFCQSPIPNP